MYLRTGAFLSRVLVDVDGSIVRLAPIGRRRRVHREVWCYVGVYGGTAYLPSLREGISHDSGLSTTAPSQSTGRAMTLYASWSRPGESHR